MSSTISLHLCLLRQDLSLNQELSNSVRLGGQWAPEICAFPARMTDDACSHACVYVGAENLSSGLHACIAITLLTESSPHYHHGLCYSVSFYPYWTIMQNDAESEKTGLDHVILWEEGREDTHCSLLANICVPKRAGTGSLWLDTVLLYQFAESASSGSKIVWQSWLSHSRWNLQGWVHGSVVECSPSMHRTIGSIPSTGKMKTFGGIRSCRLPPSRSGGLAS